jgi:hypothetical protein
MNKEELIAMTTAADNGNTEAQYSLGEHYSWDGEAEHPKLAVQWYRKAAAQGHAEAMSALAECYLSGWGVKQNKNLGFKWLVKAAEAGHSTRQWQLGQIYEKSKQDLQKADYLYKKLLEEVSGP